MVDLRQEYDIVFDGKKLGCAVVARVGIRLEIFGEIRNFASQNPFRLAVKCDGKIVCLGVMLPRKDRFTFHKIYTKSMLRELGISAIEEFTLVRDGDTSSYASAPNMTENMGSWCSVEDMSEFLEAGEFRRQFSVYKNCIACKQNDIEYLAVPIIKDKALPAMPVWCLGETRKINGKLYMVFKIRKGKLLF